MKVLVADDDPMIRHLLVRLLGRWGYDVVSVDNGDKAWEVLSTDESLVLAIIDWMMPGLTGIELVGRIRAMSSRPYVYVLLLTAKSGKSEVLQALNAGCDDYVSKPFDPEEMQARLLVGKRIIDLQAQLRSALLATQHQASHDTLTGLLNRSAILDVLREEANRALRTGAPLSVALIDIDHFKSINDTYGHLIGDEVLRATAQRFNRLVRNYDKVARFGGEEFLVVLPDSSQADATVVCERICQGLREAPIRVGGNNIAVTVSIGTALLPSPAELTAALQAADEALYCAKGNGRDRVESEATRKVRVASLSPYPTELGQVHH